VEKPPSAEAARGVEERAEEERVEEAEEKVAEETKEEFVRVGKILVKRGYEEDAVVKALEKLGRSAKVEEPKEKRAKRATSRSTISSYMALHTAPFLEHAADRIKAKPAEVRLEERHVVVKAGGVVAEVEFKLLKRHRAKCLTADDVRQTLALFKSLKALGVPVEITPKGVKVDGEALWFLSLSPLREARLADYRQRLCQAWSC